MLEYDLVIRLILAAVFGGLVGWERQKGHKPAGLRTHMLVSMGSALFTMISFMVTFDLANGGVIDSTRIAAGVVTGIGFLGAGAIIQSQEKVIGLTTAASIWIVSAIGMAIGYGLFILAGATAVLTLVILYILEKLEARVNLS